MMKSIIYLTLALSYLASSVNGQVIVTTLAGTGQPGATSGIGKFSSFNRPHGIAVDASGNVYVADTNNHRIRKINATGFVTNVAGTGVAGSTNGFGNASAFNFPQGIALDKFGNIFVADTANNAVRRIDATTGNVTTVRATELSEPKGIAVGFNGTIYVSDKTNHTVKMINSNNGTTTVSFFAGNGTRGDGDGPKNAANVAFYGLHGLAFDLQENMYIADVNNDKVKKISTDGIVSTVAGLGTEGEEDGNIQVARLFEPTSIAVDASGNIYVADHGNYKIRLITPAGVVSTFAGTGDEGMVDGAAAVSSFNKMSGIAALPDGSIIYVADTMNNVIRRIINCPPAKAWNETSAMCGNLPAAPVTNTTGSGANTNNAGRAVPSLLNSILFMSLGFIAMSLAL